MTNLSRRGCFNIAPGSRQPVVYGGDWFRYVTVVSVHGRGAGRYAVVRYDGFYFPSSVRMSELRLMVAAGRAAEAARQAVSDLRRHAEMGWCDGGR